MLNYGIIGMTEEQIDYTNTVKSSAESLLPIIDAVQHGPLILVVEDNMINQKVAQKILSKYGCNSRAVNNGREALEELQHNAYDAVLMDLQMPEMDGYEATIAIRKPATKCLNPKIPIIALTANAQPAVREKCFDLGMDDFLTKPVDPEMLIEKIRYWIDKKPRDSVV
jgi:CheY-like chemotaxis protein